MTKTDRDGRTVARPTHTRRGLKTGRRAGGPLLLASMVALMVASGGAAAAQETTDRDDLVVLTGRAEVREGEAFDSVVIFDGPATVEGTVGESVVAFNGDVDISGTVEEDVVAFNGTVTVRSGAEIAGDLVTRTRPSIEEGATIGGEIRRETFDVLREPFPFLARFIVWLAVSVSLLLLGFLLLLAAPRAADAVEAVWRTGMGPSIGWGLLFLVGLPLVGIVALVTLVGIPFGIGLLAALGLIYATGYVAGAWVLGRQLIKAPASRALAFLVGLAILRALALVPVLAGIVGALATAFGLGTVAVAIWRARRAAAATAT